MAFLAILLISPFCRAQNAAFSANVTSGCAPLTVTFTDHSTGIITDRDWNLGNGNLPQDQTIVSAIYTSPGTYNVTLTVSNGTQSDTETKTGYIIVYALPEVDFSVDKTTGCTPLEVKFTDKSKAGSGAITQWSWVFGDGGTSSSANPSHKYTIPGNKAVSLVVRNQYGCEAGKAIPGMVKPQGPAPGFKTDFESVCQVPATINFTNLSTGNGTLTYAWNFGDGQTATAKDPPHTYTVANTYTVELKAKDAQGCESSFTKKLYIGSEDGVDFTPSATQICQGQSVSFSIKAETDMLSHDWVFGNGAKSDEESPTVTYKDAGTFNVTLSAKLLGNTCHSVVTKPIEVVADPTPDFTYSTDCNYKTTFKSTAKDATRVEWFINNTRYTDANTFVYPFGAPGNYPVKLIAYNKLNCSKVIEMSVRVSGKPVASFSPNKEQDCILPSLSGCAPFTLALTNNSSSETSFTSEWSFGDGNTSTSKNPTHIYTAKGTYILTLTVTNSQGCSSTQTAKVTVSDVTPTAKFVVNKNSVCAKQDVVFTSQSQNATFFCWEFGDGGRATGSQVTHSYATPGVYTVTLTAKNAGCTDTYQIVNAVEVKDPYVDFKVGKECFNPYRITLANLSTGYNSLKWDFGDGTTETANVSEHIYQKEGDYTIRLTGTSTSTNCVVEATTLVAIREVKANFVTDNLKPCKDAPVTFTDKSSSASRLEWNFKNGATATGQNPTTTYKGPGTYRVTLRAFDTNGCFKEAYTDVEVLNIQGAFTFDAKSTCDTLKVTFKDKSTASPPIQTWNWDFGDGVTSTDPSPAHNYLAKGSYPITLTLTNSDGDYCTFIQYDVIKFTNPEPDFAAAKAGFCMNEQIQIANRTKNATLYEWDMGNGEHSKATHPVVSYPQTGSYDIKLTATDAYGCTQDTIKTAAIVVTKPVADFEAYDTYRYCPPLTTRFENHSSADVQQWLWDFGDGQRSVYTDPSNAYVRPGMFDVSLTVTDANGCTDTKKREEVVHVGGPYGTYTSNVKDASCVLDTVSFIANTTNAVTHEWDFGDGNVEVYAEMNATHVYAHPGLFIVALVLKDEKGCELVADGDVKIVINDTAKIDFTYGPSCIFQGDQFSLKAAGTQEDLTWEWQLEGHPIGSGDAIALAFDSAAEYNIALHATNQYGCASTAYRKIPVRSNLTFIPNVFTPNNDGFNDQFMIKDLDKSKWNLRIYNRWGDQVFRKDEYANDWQGGQLASGVYYYGVINAYCPDKKYKGTVSISR